MRISVFAVGSHIFRQRIYYIVGDITSSLRGILRDPVPFCRYIIISCILRIVIIYPPGDIAQIISEAELTGSILFIVTVKSQLHGITDAVP